MLTEAEIRRAFAANKPLAKRAKPASVVEIVIPIGESATEINAGRIWREPLGTQPVPTKQIGRHGSWRQILAVLVSRYHRKSKTSTDPVASSSAENLRSELLLAWIKRCKKPAALHTTQLGATINRTAGDVVRINQRREHSKYLQQHAEQSYDALRNQPVGLIPTDNRYRLNGEEHAWRKVALESRRISEDPESAPVLFPRTNNYENA